MKLLVSRCETLRFTTGNTLFLGEKLLGDENFPTLMSVLRFFFVILRGNFIGMTITELQQQYAAHPNMAVMKRLLKDTSVQTVLYWEIRKRQVIFIMT